MVLVCIVAACLKFSPSKIANFSDAMNGTLSFAAIATALLFSCFSLIPSFSNSKLVVILKDLGTDIKIMDRLLIATSIFFAVSIFSLVELFLPSSSSSPFSIFLTSTWLALLVGGINELIEIIRLMFQALQMFSNEK
jgi:hypothetical protein